MQRTDERYQAYVQILREELKPAMGCTEPIAVAYACAVARQTLEQLPQQVKLHVSGNIIKNVKSVVVPNTGGRRGLEVAAAVTTAAWLKRQNGQTHNRVANGIGRRTMQEQYCLEVLTVIRKWHVAQLMVEDRGHDADRIVHQAAI